MDDIFGQKIINFLKKVKIRLRKQNPKKNFRLRRYLRIPMGFKLLIGFSGGAALGGLRPARAAKKNFCCRV